MIVLGSKNKYQVVNSCSFGWKHSTHRLITEKLVQKANENLPQKSQLNYAILKYSCIEPDYSRKNITKYINGHFADIDNPSTNPPDARELAKIYTEKAINAHKNGLIPKRDDYLGYALHFIQDMLAPVHTEFKAVPKDHPIRLEHKEFEIAAAQEQQSAIKNAEKCLCFTDEDFFSSTLPKAMRTAKNQLLSLRKGGNVNELAKDAIINTFITTDNYLSYFCSQINKNKMFTGKKHKMSLVS